MTTFSWWHPFELTCFLQGRLKSICLPILLQQQHLARLLEFISRQRVVVETGRQRRRIKSDRVPTGRLVCLQQRRDFHPEQVVDFQAHKTALRQGKFDGGRWIEGVGVVLLQLKFVWQRIVGRFYAGGGV